MSQSALLADTRFEPTLRDAARHLTGGVSVITAGRDDSLTGLTVSTAISFSIEPPIMLISVNKKSSGFTSILKNGHFCVNILASHQQDVAWRFSGADGIKGPDRYLGQSWTRLKTGALALDGALANIDCEVDDVVERYSHGLFFGAVRAVRVNDTTSPQLVYLRGSYGSYP
ncbi:flavin reductase family protein [Aestuariivirga sp.]|uniref:flavin reductase family protein n=1 Tax=Aestuariivirga sp. TaxID=2650926 RepID=UPI0039E4A3DF